MDKCEIILYWSREDKAFITEVPEVPRCTAYGETHEMALANAGKRFGSGSILHANSEIRFLCRRDRASGCLEAVENLVSCLCEKNPQIPPI